MESIDLPQSAQVMFRALKCGDIVRIALHHPLRYVIIETYDKPDFPDDSYVKFRELGTGEGEARAAGEFTELTVYARDLQRIHREWHLVVRDGP